MSFSFASTKVGLISLVAKLFLVFFRFEPKKGGKGEERSSFPDDLKEILRFVVDNKRIRKGCLCEEGQCKVVVANGGGVMGIAAEDDGHFVLFAEAEHLEEQGVSQFLVAHGVERTAVEFEECACALGCQHNGFDVEVRGCAIAWMRNDVDVGILDSPQQGRSVLFSGAIGVAELVKTCDDVIHAVERVWVGDIYIALIVDDVQFRSKQQTHVAILTGHYVQVAEIDFGTSAWDGRSVFGHAKQRQMMLLCLSNHFVEGTERMA